MGEILGTPGPSRTRQRSMAPFKSTQGLYNLPCLIIITTINPLRDCTTCHASSSSQLSIHSGTVQPAMPHHHHHNYHHIYFWYPFHLQKALSIKWREQMTHQVGKHSNLYSYTNYMLYKHFTSLNSQSTHYRNNFGAWGQLYNHKINPKTISHLTVSTHQIKSQSFSPSPHYTHTLYKHKTNTRTH